MLMQAAQLKKLLNLVTNPQPEQIICYHFILVSPCIWFFLWTCHTNLDRDCFSDISPTVDPTWDFSLEISAASSLTECLKQFTKAEYLGKGRQCPSCKACDSTKQLTLKTLPIVVTIHLKRFTARTKEESTNGEKMEMLKLSKRISFPETLDLTEFVTRNSVAIVPSDNRYNIPFLQTSNWKNQPRNT